MFNDLGFDLCSYSDYSWKKYFFENQKKEKQK
jgi:hypothetical protein